MRTFLISLACFFFIKAGAQHTVAAEVSGVLSLQRFPHDSFPGWNARPVAIAANAFVSGYYYFSLRNPLVQLKVGLGYEQHNFTARLDNPVAGVPMTNKYLNFPVGISYCLGKRRSNIFVNAEMQLNTEVLLSSTARLDVDTSVTQTPVTSAQKQELERQYANTSSSIIFSLMPRLNTRIRIYKGLGVSFDLQPIMFYLNSSNRILFREGAGFYGSLGLFYDF